MPRRSPQPDGPPPPPTVQRIRIRYAKRGRLRFTSHRDVARVVERAVRRAGLPIAHSAGFSPHPRISWMGAAPTGVASEAEYVELGLTAEMDPAVVRARLDAALPPDLDVLDAVVAGPGSLVDRLEASVWQVRTDAPVGRARAAVEAFLAADAIAVERRTKDGSREIDVRSAVLALRVEAPGQDGDCAILRVVVRHTTPVVRPDDVLAALRAVASLDTSSPPVATRLAQGPLRDPLADGAAGQVADPLEPDRVAREQVETLAGTA